MRKCIQYTLSDESILPQITSLPMGRCGLGRLGSGEVYGRDDFNMRYLAPNTERKQTFWPR